MRLAGPFSSGVATGSSGEAAANADTQLVTGQLLGMYVRYNDSPPAETTDVTIKTKGTAPAAPSYDLLALTNAATSGLFLPRKEVVDQAGAALVFASTDGVPAPIPVADALNIAIAGANAGDSVDIWLFLE